MPGHPAGRDERPAPSDIWRTWLVTGARSHAIDRRRLRGAHRGLKQMLAEGGEPDAVARPWGNFSRAMARQQVNEAMGRLPSRERVVITMAYFAGFSNAQIADQLGWTVHAVQRNLAAAVSHLSKVLERSRRAALAVLFGVVGARAGRWLVEAVAPAGAQGIAAAAVVGVLAAAPLPSAVTPPQAAPSPRHQAAAAAQSARPGVPAAASSGTTAAAPVSVPSSSTTTTALPQVKVPLTAPTVPKAPAVKVPRTSLPRLP